MSHIQIAAVDYRLFLIKFTEISPHIVLKLHAVINTLQAVLRIRNIAAYEVKIFIFAGDNTSLIHVSSVDAVSNVQGLCLSEYSRT